MLEAWRQWAVPREFRIAPPEWPEEALRHLEQIAQGLERLIRQPVSPAGSDTDCALADVGTSLWRLSRDLLPLAKSQPSDGLRRAVRRFEAAWDALKQSGIQVRDLTGLPFDRGMSVEVLAHQPTAGLGAEQIVETVRPEVYRHDRLIQRAQVIVGTPVR